MIPVTNLRSGRTFQTQGTPYQVIKYTHTKMGRGGATIKVSARNLKTGNIEDKTFNNGAQVEPVETTKRKLQYLYKDEKNTYFLDPKTFEQSKIPKSILSGNIKFLKEGEEVSVLFWSKEEQDVALAVEIPPNVTLKVAQTSPGIKGNSATNVYKDATLENGLKTKIPLFINTGESVKVDTKTGEYIERVKQKSTKGQQEQ